MVTQCASRVNRGCALPPIPFWWHVRPPEPIFRVSANPSLSPELRPQFPVWHLASRGGRFDTQLQQTRDPISVSWSSVFCAP